MKNEAVKRREGKEYPRRAHAHGHTPRPGGRGQRRSLRGAQRGRRGRCPPPPLPSPPPPRAPLTPPVGCRPPSPTTPRAGSRAGRSAARGMGEPSGRCRARTHSPPSPRTPATLLRHQLPPVTEETGAGLRHTALRPLAARSCQSPHSPGRGGGRVPGQRKGRDNTQRRKTTAPGVPCEGPAPSGRGERAARSMPGRVVPSSPRAAEPERGGQWAPRPLASSGERTAQARAAGALSNGASPAPAEGARG